MVRFRDLVGVGIAPVSKKTAVKYMTGFVLDMAGFVLKITGFILNLAGFVLNKTGFIQKNDWIFLKSSLPPFAL